MQSFFKGTLLLMLVILISKLLGFIYRMQFMRIAGEEAVGMYMSAYPAFVFFIAVIQLGIPVAVAKLVAQHTARQQFDKLAAVWQRAWTLTGLSIIAFSIPLFIAIPFISTYLLKQPQMAPILYTALAIVPIVVIASLFRAYLQGIAHIAPTAWTQLIEQCIRIGLTMTLLPLAFVQTSPLSLAVYAMAITGIGELVSLCLSFYFYRRAQRKINRTVVANTSMTKPILRLAVPSAVSRLFGTFTWFLEPIIFLFALTRSGLSAPAAMTLYGIISGVHIPLLLFPSFIPNALSIVLIPAVSDALARANATSLRQRINISLRASVSIGCFAATIFFLYGDWLAVELFHLESDRHYMQLLAPIFFFYYIQSPLHSILQATDQAKAAMMNSIYGGIGKLIVMAVLASQPFLQEKGAILAIGFGVIVTSFLHMATLRQHPKLHIHFRQLLLPYAVFIVVCVWQVLFPFPGTIVMQMIGTVFVTMLLLILTRQLQWADVQFIRSRLFSRL